MIYLISEQVKDGYNFKIGFTSNLDKRMLAYSTHNPNAELLETVMTYGKTKNALEKAVHAELKAKGYTFLQSKITGAKTEWFFLPTAQAEIFRSEGLAQFKVCKGRKVKPANLNKNALENCIYTPIEL